MTVQTSSYMSGLSSLWEGSRRGHEVCTSSPPKGTEANRQTELPGRRARRRELPSPRSKFAVSRFLPLFLVVVLGTHCSLFASTLVALVPPENESGLAGLLEEFPLLREDRFFWIENRGLTRVYVDLNGHKFILTVDPAEVQQGRNMYLIPRQGDITIDMVAYMQSENNWMRIISRGPPGTDADVLVGDSTIVNGGIDYVLQLVPLPKSVALFQNFPNPFNLTTTIRYEIADNLVDGVDVELTLFDMLGRKVRTLVRDHRFHGAFSTQWDGLVEGGAVAASGTYLYRLKAGDFVETKRLVLVK